MINKIEIASNQHLLKQYISTHPHERIIRTSEDIPVLREDTPFRIVCPKCYTMKIGYFSDAEDILKYGCTNCRDIMDERI